MSIRRSDSFFLIAPWCVVVLFVVKAAVTGLWLVRPWDVPDEVGHFSYIKNLAEGHGLPVLQKTLIDEEIWPTFVENAPATAGLNWIAQHPPLYHALMVPAYWFGGLFGSDFWGSFYMVRLATCVVFGLGIWVLMNAFREFGLSPGVSLGAGLMVAHIPNHTYLAGGVNHDALVFLSAGLVLLAVVRFCKSGSGSDLVWLGLWLGLGGLIKYTLLVLVPPVLFFSVLRFYKSDHFSWGTTTRYVLLTLFPIGIWISRNLVVYGKLLPVDTSGFVSANPLELTFLKFGQEYPIFSTLIQSFWGLLGWMGDGSLQVRWLPMYTIYQQVYILPVTVMLCLSGYILVQRARGSAIQLVGGFTGAVLLTFLTISSGWLEKEFNHYLPILMLIPAVGGWILVQTLFLLRAGKLDTHSMIQVACVVSFFFFLVVYLERIYSFSVTAGALQGTFGRYFFPVFGMVVLGFFSPALRYIRWAGHVVLVSSMVYGGVELYVWLHEAVPFFYIYE